MRLKDRLEEEFEEGVLAVERSGTCAGFEWTVTWETFGGDHPEMQVNGDSLSGNEVSISVQTIQNGGLFLEPIPGEFLRTPHSSGQVSCLSWQTSICLIRERGLIACLSHYCSSPLFCFPSQKLVYLMEQTVCILVFLAKCALTPKSSCPTDS